MPPADLLHQQDPEARLAKVLLINRYFHPDESATSQMASSLAFALAASGWETHAVTSRQQYTAVAGQRPGTDKTGNTRIHRVWTTRFGRQHLIGRAIDYLTFYLSAFSRLILSARRGDVIITLTDPPLMSVLSSFAAQMRGCHHINWLQDIFPEVACRLGVVSPGIWTRLMIWLRNRSRRNATMNVVIGDLMGSFLELQNVPRRSIAVIHNWSDGNSIAPRPPQENPLRREWALEGKFVVGYSGNLGRAHDFRTALQAALALRHDPSVHFLFVGGGYHLESLRMEAQKLSLSNISIQPYQPASGLRNSLTLPDVHLISLQPSLEGLIVPSKFYGIAAAGRPTIFIGDPCGEIPSILQNFDCGTAVRMGDGIALARSIKSLQEDARQQDAWGANARAMFTARFDRPHAIREWVRILKHSTARKRLPLQSSPSNVADNA
jgi:glycosyltransferase involved in cell wall biosynthesis